MNKKGSTADGKKESFYFSHDYDPRRDLKMIKLRAKYGEEFPAVYGVYWMLVETIAQSSSTDISKQDLDALAYDFGVETGWLSDLVEFCISIDLFIEDGGYFTSQRMLDHKEQRRSIQNQKKKAAQARWKSAQERAGADAMHMHSTSNAPEKQNDAKERKGKKRKGKENSSSEEIVLPFVSDDFKKAWANWETFRREIKKPLVRSTMEHQLTFLKKKSGGDESLAIAILNQSITNQWQGLFELKTEATSDKSATPSQPVKIRY